MCVFKLTYASVWQLKSAIHILTFLFMFSLENLAFRWKYIPIKIQELAYFSSANGHLALNADISPAFCFFVLHTLRFSADSKTKYWGHLSGPGGVCHYSLLPHGVRSILQQGMIEQIFKRKTNCFKVGTTGSQYNL